MTALYKRYEKEQPCATWHYASTFGACIYDPIDDDKYETDFIVSWCNGEREYNYRRHKIHYTATGRPYLRKGAIRIYLDECICYYFVR